MQPLKLLIASSLVLSSSLASAGVIIDSIHVKMAKTSHSVRGASDPDDALASAMGAFNAGSQFCDQSLDAFTNISSRGTCGGTRRNYGALYTISGFNSGITEFEFGLDWGRGGFILSEAGEDPALIMDNSDIWWRRDWDHNDVLPLTLFDQGAFTLTLLGFEGCCDGINSARYRNFDQEAFFPARRDHERADPSPDDPILEEPRSALRQLPLEPEWQALEVSAVPLPGSLPLMGLGALLMLARRKARTDAPGA